MDQCTRAGLVLDVTDGGPADGEPVVLLHGWPQDRTAWRRVGPQLQAAGLRTLAPDQRGCSPRARPRGRAAYRVGELVGDVVALLDQTGLARAHLVGHDWGGAVAWAMAERHPERLRTLTVLSTPHHHALSWALRHRDQAVRSWYMLAAQLPLLPETVLRVALPTILRRTGLPRDDAQRYAARLREPGAATGSLNWYRALPLEVGLLPAPRGRAVAGPATRRRITVPTTYVWGRHDPALGRAAAERTERWVVSDYRFVELDAGHWLPEREPDAVAAAVLARVTGS